MTRAIDSPDKSERRAFDVERWCLLGSIDDWIDVGLSGPLNRLVEPAIARLGDDSFYEPFWHEYDGKRIQRCVSRV